MMTLNSDQLPTIWRINLKSKPRSNVDPRRFCIDNGFLGFGWPVPPGQITTPDNYRRAAAAHYPADKGWAKAFHAMQTMSVGDLCWTRDHGGEYYLGRVTGAWMYLATEEHVQADIVNIRPCDWMHVGSVEQVPGKVLASFRPAATVQRIFDPTVQLYSALLYNETAGATYALPTRVTDLFSLLGDEDCEDLVGLWMQLDGYLLLPSSCKLDTVRYEWVMVHRDSGDRAYAQVKSGRVDLYPNEYAGAPGRVYLFTSQGQYHGNRPDSVRCIETAEMREFVTRHRRILPKRICHWLEFVERND